MKLYQIYLPELATYVKYKVLDPESIDTLIEELDNKSPKDFKLAILENVIYNVKPDITESLRMMSREAAERCIDAMYYGCVMLNPGLDIDLWIELAYARDISNKDKGEKDFPNLSSIEADIAQHIQNKFEKKHTAQSKPKIKKITKQKFLGLQDYLETNVIGQTEAIESVVSALKRSQVGLNDKNRPLGVFLFAGPSGVRKDTFSDISA